MYKTFIIVTVFLVIIVMVSHFIWVKKSVARSAFLNLTLVITSIIYILLILEYIFANFVIQSDGINTTLSSRKWTKTYWNPINSNGYRDYEHEWKENILFIVGDSFVAGHGINNISDRFSSILSDKLGDKWSVAIIAQNGWNPMQEFDALKAHTKNPNYVIVSYFINDIDSAAEVNGIKPPANMFNQPEGLVKEIINTSYLANWLYWRLYRGGFGNGYIDYINVAYNNPKVWFTHKQELNKFIQYAERLNINIGFVLWPNLGDVQGSRNILSKVDEFLSSKKVKVLNLVELLANRKSSALIVNSIDPHPNAELNHEVAALIYEKFEMVNFNHASQK